MTHGAPVKGFEFQRPDFIRGLWLLGIVNLQSALQVVGLPHARSRLHFSVKCSFCRSNFYRRFCHLLVQLPLIKRVFVRSCNRLCVHFVRFVGFRVWRGQKNSIALRAVTFSYLQYPSFPTHQSLMSNASSVWFFQAVVVLRHEMWKFSDSDQNHVAIEKCGQAF